MSQMMMLLLLLLPPMLMRMPMILHQLVPALLTMQAAEQLPMQRCHDSAAMTAVCDQESRA